MVACLASGSSLNLQVYAVDFLTAEFGLAKEL
jgi:hypothetical protein